MKKVKAKKTIAFYIGSLSRGGAEHVIVNLAEYFKKIGYEVVIVTKLQDEDEYPVPEGVERILADLTDEEISKSRVKNLLGRILKLRKIWKKTEADCIVSFIKKNNFMAIVSSRFLNIPVIISVRSNPSREYPDFLNRLLVKILFPMADGIVLQTKRAKEFFPKGIQKKSIVLPNSISQQFLKEVYGGPRKQEIVWVGRMDRNKNPQMLLDVFLKIGREYPQWKMKFIGSGYELEKMKERCKEKQMEEQLEFPGNITEVAEAIAESSIFVLTSKQEGMPNALIEAMVSGLAVIATDCPIGGPAELIQDGVNGYLIPVDDREALENRLRRLMTEETERIEMAHQAKKIINIVHPDVVNEQWKRYIEELL